MKINNNVLYIPPYISTTWNNIASLHLSEKEGKRILVIILKNDSIMEVPNLADNIINLIFDAHAKSLEKDENILVKEKSNAIGFGFPLNSGPGIESMGAAMQHNPDQKDAPDLPKDVLSKIVAVSKALGLNETGNFPKPEPHCNCMHCQIARSLQLGDGTQEENLEEEVLEEDLKFRTWDIKELGEKLYSVTNPLNKQEEYRVFLGEPLGCTCGEKNCEHIKAVLNS